MKRLTEFQLIAMETFDIEEADIAETKLRFGAVLTELRRLRGLIVRTHGGHYEATAEQALNAEAEAIREETKR